LALGRQVADQRQLEAGARLGRRRWRIASSAQRIAQPQRRGAASSVSTCPEAAKPARLPAARN
jgi:hypothetical protein